MISKCILFLNKKKKYLNTVIRFSLWCENFIILKMGSEHIEPFDIKLKNSNITKSRKKIKGKPSTKIKNTVKVSRVLRGKSNKYKIPKKKFQKALDMINNNALWEDEPKHLKYCSIVSKCNEYSRNTMINLLIEARNCLLRRDWVNLAKILTIPKPSSSYEVSHFFQPFVKYAAICLAHNPDLNLMDMFLEGVVACKLKRE